MSYILEALRKSQQERELARVPVSESQDLTGGGETEDSGRWVLATMAMAVVAVVISLYAVFGSRIGGGPEAPPEWQSDSVQPTVKVSGDEPATTSGRAAAVGPVAGPGRAAPASPQPGVVVERTDQVGPSEVSPRPRSDRALPPAVGSSQRPADRAAAIEPPARSGTSRHTGVTGDPPPKHSRDIQSATPEGGRRVSQSPPLVMAPADRPQRQDTGSMKGDAALAGGDAGGGFRREAELLRTRLLDAEKKTKSPEQVPSAARRPDGDRGEEPSRQGPAGVADVEPEIAGAGSGERLRSAAELPAHLLKSLPPRNILVHVYNDSADKRFVILNSHRQTQGETTPDGFVVEQIRPDGVVLSFRGERFFHPR